MTCIHKPALRNGYTMVFFLSPILSGAGSTGVVEKVAFSLCERCGILYCPQETKSAFSFENEEYAECPACNGTGGVLQSKFDVLESAREEGRIEGAQKIADILFKMLDDVHVRCPSMSSEEWQREIDALRGFLGPVRDFLQLKTE